MRIYTRGGDKGRTSLFSGERVDKHALRIEALGDVDELVAVLGLAKLQIAEDDLRERIAAAQGELYLAMADIATAGAETSRLPDDCVAQLESAIDAMDGALPPLTEFLIPGTTPASAALHHARTICRRAERSVVALARAESVPDPLPAWLNRLADWLFVLARWVDRAGEGADVTFKGQANR